MTKKDKAIYDKLYNKRKYVKVKKADAQRKYRAKYPHHSAEILARRRKANRQWVFTLKNGPCHDCGKCYHPCVMQFDHVRGTKFQDVSQTMQHSRKIILEEIAKCELVCANCHAMRTYMRKQYLAQGNY